LEDNLRDLVLRLSFTLGVLCCFSLNAGVVNITVPGGPFYASTTNCQDAFGSQSYSNCSVTGYISSNLADSTTPFMKGLFNGPSPTGDFADAFNSWNNTQGSSQWTLVQGALNGSASMDVSNFAVSAPPGAVGGISQLNLNLTYDPGAGDPTLGQLVWIQGLYVNYQPPNNPSILQTTLDTYSFSQGGPFPSPPFNSPCIALGSTPAANNTTPFDFSTPTSSGRAAYCDPIYPFQYSSKLFYDGPRGYYSPSGSFRGIALMGTVTYVTDANDNITSRVLIVYDGINYGFDNTAAIVPTVPEPSTVVLLFAGVPCAAFAIRRRRA
jgi:hypothetical protein